MSKSKKKYEILQNIITTYELDYYSNYYYDYYCNSYYDEYDDNDDVFYDYLPNSYGNYRPIDMMSFYEKDVLRQKKIDYLLNNK